MANIFKKIGRGIKKATGAISKLPVVNKLMGAIPVVGPFASAGVSLLAGQAKQSKSAPAAVKQSPVVQNATRSMQVAMNEPVSEPTQGGSFLDKAMEFVKKNWWTLPLAGLVIVAGIFVFGKKSASRRRSPARRRAAATARKKRK